MIRRLFALLLSVCLVGSPVHAMSPELSATVEAAIGRFDPPLAFATRLALLDARLAGDGPNASDLAEAASYAGSITPPPRFARDVAGLSTALSAFADAPAPEAVAALRAELARLQATAFQPGVDPILNRLRAIELLLQIASSLYAEAVAPDGTPLAPDDIRFARGIVLVAAGLYSSIERDLDNRVQSITAGMTNILGMVRQTIAGDPATGLARPEEVGGLIEFFLSYSANF